MTTNKILLVEDEVLFAETIRQALVRFGHTVVLARDGREALKLYDPGTFNVVLTDMIMPDMDGVELIMALSRANPAVKVIAMSGGGRNGPQIYLKVAERVGAVKTIVKPFTFDELLDAVRECQDE